MPGKQRVRDLNWSNYIRYNILQTIRVVPLRWNVFWKGIDPTSIFNKKPSELWDFLCTEDDREWFWLEKMHFIIIRFPKYAHASAVEQRARLSFQYRTKPAQAAARQLYGPLCCNRSGPRSLKAMRGDVGYPAHTLACKPHGRRRKEQHHSPWSMREGTSSGPSSSCPSCCKGPG